MRGKRMPTYGTLLPLCSRTCFLEPDEWRLVESLVLRAAAGRMLHESSLRSRLLSRGLVWDSQLGPWLLLFWGCMHAISVHVQYIRGSLHK